MSKPTRTGLLTRAGEALDRVVAVFNPVRASERAHARRVFAYYEAARSSRLRKGRRESGSGNTAVLRAGTSLREQARHLEQNHDIARGVLQVLVANTVGPNGIGIEPQPRTTDGKIHTDVARQIRQLHRNWSERPEVTWQHDWPSAQRLLARSWFRDGEVFVQRLLGAVRYLDHGTDVPYSLEMMESDMVPLDISGKNINQGIETNAWGRPVAYWAYREHPGETYRLLTTQDLKRIAADRILHCKSVDRIRQLRGVSVFASVLGRLDDIKDYEESERIAAKVAASMAAFIIKGAPEQYNPDDSNEDQKRRLKFRPGMVFDDLQPGEQVGTVDTNRPNVNLDKFIGGQLRRVASGVGTTYSSLSKNYDGTYSAQRQELVEGWGAYQILAAEFISRIVRPAYQDMLLAARATGLLSLPRDLDLSTLDDALYVAPQMPWIDPVKEANAWVTLESAGHASAPEIIRRRGQNPDDVLEQEARWQEAVREKGLRFEPMLSPDGPAPSEGAPSNAGKKIFIA